MKLRLYGSKYVVKYPRCSIRRQLTYADAEVTSIISWLKFLSEVWTCIIYYIKLLTIGFWFRTGWPIIPFVSYMLNEKKWSFQYIIIFLIMHLMWFWCRTGRSIIGFCTSEYLVASFDLRYLGFSYSSCLFNKISIERSFYIYFCYGSMEIPIGDAQCSH